MFSFWSEECECELAYSLIPLRSVFSLKRFKVITQRFIRNIIIPGMCVCKSGHTLSILSIIWKKMSEYRIHSGQIITTERFLAGLSCEGESPGVLRDEWLDWGLFNWLLWSGWSFLKKDWEYSNFSWVVTPRQIAYKVEQEEAVCTLGHKACFGKFMTASGWAIIIYDMQRKDSSSASFSMEEIITDTTKLNKNQSLFIWYFCVSGEAIYRRQPQRLNTVQWTEQ